MSDSGNEDRLGSNSPPGGESAAAADTEGGPRVCAHCEAPLDADQLYCLECGSPTDIAPTLARPRKAGPLIAAGLIGLGLVGGGVAFAVLQNDDTPSDGAEAVVSTVDTAASDPATEIPSTTEGGLPPDPNAPSTDGATTFEDPDELEPPGGETTFEDPPATAPGPEEEAVSDWPAGRDAWTVFVSSVRDGAEAVGTKQRLAALGEPAGLLFSSDHQGLNPGYWVVYSGVFDTRAEAVDQATTLAVDFPGANPRRVVS